MSVYAPIFTAVIHGDTALFTNHRSQLLVFYPPGPAIDITRPLTKRAVRQNGWRLGAEWTVRVHQASKIDGGVRMVVLGDIGESSDIILTWEEIADMARQAKAQQAGGSSGKP
jgi:hypothetical protein